jgi:hypothetical protein
MTQTEQIAAEMNRIRRIAAARAGTTPQAHAAGIEAARALEARLAPAFQAELGALKLPELKAMAKRVRAFTRGCRVRKDWERAIVKVWRSNVWDAAGYRYGPRPMRVFEVDA